MKKCIVIALVAGIWAAAPLGAQELLTKDRLLLDKNRHLLKKEDLLVQLPLLDPGSLLLAPGRPAPPTRSRSLHDRLAALRQLCPAVKEARPTLVLEGERHSNEQVGLKWETTNGRDQHSFYVERSLGDTLHFQTINLVWARSLQKFKEKYRLPDDNNYEGISYYRLRLTGAGNRMVYSNIAAVKGYRIEHLSVSPNPAAQTAWLTLYTPQQGGAHISLFDARGRKVQQLPALLGAGSNAKALDLSGLPSGVYLVTITLPDKTVRTARVVKE